MWREVEREEGERNGQKTRRIKKSKRDKKEVVRGGAGRRARQRERERERAIDGKRVHGLGGGTSLT